LAPAEACGIAFQLTNILRDVKEDAGRDRIYLPLEDMQRFGVSEADIIQQRFSPAFKALMKFEADRARGYYERAQPLFGLIAPDSRATLAVMVGVYSALLDKIVARDFAVFERRVRLTGPEKLLVAVRSWWRYRA
jgi:phytoene synthase